MPKNTIPSLSEMFPELVSGGEAPVVERDLQGEYQDKLHGATIGDLMAQVRGETDPLGQGTLLKQLEEMNKGEGTPIALTPPAGLEQGSPILVPEGYSGNKSNTVLEQASAEQSTGPSRPTDFPDWFMNLGAARDLPIDLSVANLPVTPDMPMDVTTGAQRNIIPTEAGQVDMNPKEEEENSIFSSKLAQGIGSTVLSYGIDPGLRAMKGLIENTAGFPWLMIRTFKYYTDPEFKAWYDSPERATSWFNAIETPWGDKTPWAYKELVAPLMQLMYNPDAKLPTTITAEELRPQMIKEMYDKAGVPGVVGQALVQMGSEIMPLIVTMQAGGGKSLPQSGVSILGTLQNSFKIAGLAALTTSGELETKLRNAKNMFILSATPLLSAGLPTKTMAVIADFALNSTGSLFNGSYADAIEQAKALASYAGDKWEELSDGEKAKYVIPYITAVAAFDYYFSKNTMPRNPRTTMRDPKWEAQLDANQRRELRVLEMEAQKKGVSKLASQVLSKSALERVIDGKADVSKVEEMVAFAQEGTPESAARAQSIVDPESGMVTRRRLMGYIQGEYKVTSSEASDWVRILEAFARGRGEKLEDFLTMAFAGLQHDGPGTTFPFRIDGKIVHIPKEENPFALIGPYVLTDSKVLGMPSNVALDGTQVHGRLKKLLPPDELAIYEGAGLQEFLKEKRTPGEVAIWMRENGPKVEVKKLQAKQQSEYQIASAALQHYLDTLPEAARKDAQEVIEGTRQRHTLVDRGWDEEEVAKFAKLENAVFQAPAERLDRNDSATARYTQVNPKPLENMPGAVDILVRIPIVETGRTPGGAKMGRTGDIKYKSTHYPMEGKNLLTHVRGYMETTPDGKKVFHVFEVQSDWGQERREAEKRYELQVVGKDFKGQDVYIVYDNKRKLAVVPSYEGLDRNKAETLRQQKIDSSTPTDPLLPHYEKLALKAAIDHARKEGATHIAVSDADTAMLTEGHDRAAQSNAILKDLDDINFSYKRKIEVGDWGERLEDGRIYVWGRTEREAIANFKRYYGTTKYMGLEQVTKEDLTPRISQEPGMRLHYDQSIPKIMEQLTGEKGKRVEFEEHKNALNGIPGEGPFVDQEGRTIPRSDLILKNPDGTPKTSISARLYDLRNVEDQFTIFGNDKAEKPTFEAPGQKASITFDGVKAILKSFSSVNNLDGLVHETGHLFMLWMDDAHIAPVAQWAAKWMKGSKTETIADKAARAETLLRKFQADTAAFQKDPASMEQLRELHESFANAFMKYMREGKAPSKSLTGVFDRFKIWLKQMYATVKSLPTWSNRLSPDLVKVFDEMLTTPEERFGGRINTHQIDPITGEAVSYEVVRRTRKDGTTIPMVNVPLNGRKQWVDVRHLLPFWNKDFSSTTKAKFQEELKSYLGPDPTWESPYEKENWYQQELGVDSITQQEYYLSHLPELTRAQLNKAARKLGLSKPESVKNHSDLLAMVEAKARGDAKLDRPDTPGEEIEILTLEHAGESWITKAVRSVYDVWAAPLISKLENSTGDSKVRLGIAHQARLVCDKIGDLVGENTEQLRRVQLLCNELGKAPGWNKTSREVMQELMRKIPTRRGTGAVTVMETILESELLPFRPDLSTISPEAQQVVREFSKLYDKIGEQATRKEHKLKILVTNPEDGSESYIDFDPKTSKSGMNRVFSGEGWRAICSSPKVREAIAKAIADMTGADEDGVLRELDAVAKNPVKRIGLEFARKLKVMPSSVVVDGKTYELLHTHPFWLSRAMVEQSAARLGFISQFPQKRTELEALMRNLHALGIRDRDVDRLFRALNGVPIGEFYTIDSTNPLYGPYQWFRAGLLWKKTGLLSFAAMSNITETPARVPAFIGAGRYARALAQLGIASAKDIQHVGVMFEKALDDPTYSGEILAGLRRQGAVSLHIQNWIVDPDNPALSKFKLWGQAALAATQTPRMNRINEYITALSANEMVKDLQAGNGTAGDRIRLELLKFNRVEIEKLMTKEASRELYNAVVQRAVKSTQGTHLRSAEKSVLANNPLYNDLIIFDSYGRNAVARTVDTILKIKELQKRPGAKVQEKIATWQVAGQLLTGSLLSGGMLLAFRQFFNEGPMSFQFEDWWEKNPAEQKAIDIARFTKEALMAVQFSGPLDSMTGMLERGQRNPLAQAMRATLPTSMLSDIIEAAQGTGRYSGMSNTEKWLRYLTINNVTVSSKLMNIPAMLGLGNDSLDMRNAIKRHYEFIRNYQGTTVRQTLLPGSIIDLPDEVAAAQRGTEAFQQEMRAAYKLMKDRRLEHPNEVYANPGASPIAEINEHLQKAIGEDGVRTKKDVAKSLRHRMLMNQIGNGMPKEVREKLLIKYHQRMPKRYLDQVELHDKILEMLARARE